MYWKPWLPRRDSWIYYLIIGLFILSIFVPQHNKVQWAQSLVERRVHEKMSMVSSNLPHKTYQAIEDSIRYKVQNENMENLSPAPGWSIGPFGVSEKTIQNKAEYYFYSDGYYLDPSADYYSEDDKNYITWLDLAGGQSRQLKDSTRLRIIREGKEETDKVLFPVSRTGYFIIQTVLILIFVAFLYYTLKIYFSYGSQLLKNISRGKAFTGDNVYFLRSIAIYFLVVGIVPPLLKILLNLILKASVPGSVHFSWYSTIMANSYAVIGGLIILLFMKAFSQGESMVEEQELTV
jgi:hypothetical protein